MIFVTVGHQMPFDRLIKAVDAWAAERGRSDVFAQIGETTYTPSHIDWVNALQPTFFREKAADADAIVSHAGTGTILTAMELCKPILLMPRRAALMETRNEHQVATAERFKAMGHVHVASDEHELAAILDQLSGLKTPGRLTQEASSALLQTIGSFIRESNRR